MSDPRVRAVLPLAWGVAALALSRWPAARRALPALSALDGPLGAVLVALSVALAVGRWWRPRLRALPRARVLFAAAALVHLATGLWYASRLRVSGDEPHYLLIAQSLWREGDLDLRDNFAREDWREYTPGPVAPHWAAPRRDGRPFPAHSPGLPLLLAPIYAAGGRLACVAMLALAAAALAGLVHALALRVTGDERRALLAWAVAAGPPAAYYAFHVYTEIPSALALASSLELLLRAGEPGTARRRWGQAAGAALCASTLPWLHVKMAAAAAGLGALAVWRLRGAPRRAFVAVAALMAIGYAAFFVHVWGLASPLALYGGAAPGTGERRPLLALAGLVLDRSFGLVPHAPVFLLAAVGAPSLLGCARRRPAAMGLLVTGALVVLPVLAWRMWWGGQCPPARFLVPLVPALAAAAALAAPAGGRGLWRWRWPLAALGAVLSVFMASDPGRLLMLNRGDRPTRLWAALSGAADLNGYLPSVVAADARELGVLLIWLAALGVLFALHAAATRHDALDRAFRGLGLPLVLLLAVSFAVDRLARPPEKAKGPAEEASVGPD
jgi:hypothetical protein